MRRLILIVLALVYLPLANAGSIFETTLKNGLKVIVKEDTRAPVVMSQIWYKVGSAFEPGGITGVSHVLEHMMFKGTKTSKPGQFATTIAQNGGRDNAFTSMDYTGYWQELAADKLPISFKLEADRMQHLVLDKKEFANELQVVMEERRMRINGNPKSLTYERFMAAAHLSAPYHHPVLGWMNDLQNMQVSDLQHWYNTWYAPNNATVVVVGDVQHENVFALAKKYFANIPMKTIPTIKPQLNPEAVGERTVNVNAPAKLPYLWMGYNVPSLANIKNKQDAYALNVLAGILDGGFSARIEKNIVRKQQIATNAGAGYSLYARFPTLFMFAGTPAANHSTDDLKQAFIAQIKDIQAGHITAKELTRVKRQLIAEDVFAKDSLTSEARQFALLETVGLSWKDSSDYIKHIKSVTAAQIQKVAVQYLIVKRLTIATLKPTEIKPQGKSQ